MYWSPSKRWKWKNEIMKLQDVSWVFFVFFNLNSLSEIFEFSIILFDTLDTAGLAVK